MMLLISTQAPLIWQAPHQLAAVLASQARQLTVLAWGRNVEGQCGVEGDVPVVARPLPILELHGAAVNSIHAGTLSSAAVLKEEVLTWGDGASGKLGHGSGDDVTSPSRIESFIGRSAISSAAMGHHHTLFLDTGGGVWACGENKEGQCGLGLPLEALAGRYRKAYYESIRPAAAYMSQEHVNSDRFAQYLRAAVSGAAAGGATATAAGAEASPYVAQGWGSLSGISSSRSSSRAHSQQQQQQFSQLFEAQQQRKRVAAAAGFDISGGSSSSNSGVSYGLAGGLFSGASNSSSNGAGSISSSGLWGGAGLEALLHSSRLLAGQVGVPARVASEQSTALMGLSLSSSSSSSVAAVGCDSGSQPEGLEGSCVVGVSASRYFSLAVTDKGEVWAWGADYNGALGSESSWLSSPQRVAAPISEALAAAGGAVAAAAGGTFSAALTAEGTVLVWGKLGGGSPAAPGLTAAAATVSSSSSASSSSSSSGMFAQVQLPAGIKVCSISAGQQHLLLSDGQKVWAVGRWLDTSGDEAGVASWDQPKEVLSLPTHGLPAADQGHRTTHQGSCSSTGTRISKVVAGMHSSAAIASDGRLWLWGRLLNEQRGLGILRRFGGEKYAAGVDWSWAGFGGAEPRLVEGVAGVRDVALGGWHAMVLVD